MCYITPGRSDTRVVGTSGETFLEPAVLSEWPGDLYPIKQEDRFKKKYVQIYSYLQEGRAKKGEKYKIIN